MDDLAVPGLALLEDDPALAGAAVADPADMAAAADADPAVAALPKAQYSMLGKYSPIRLVR